MSGNRLPRSPYQPDDPLDVAALLRARADADALWAGLISAEDHTPAGHALRTYMRERRDAWLTVARFIEGVADLQLTSRFWRVLDVCAERRDQGGPKGPIYDTAGELLLDVLERMDAAPDDDDDAY